MPLLPLGVVQPTASQSPCGGLTSLGQRLERGAIPSYVHTPKLRVHPAHVKAAVTGDAGAQAVAPAVQPCDAVNPEPRRL
jgi:hypothetical protein